ncbi:MAG: cysteine synthase A [Halioglobus sp.]
MARYNNILETIGRTPLVRLNKLAPEGVNVYVKVESFNPMGSIKDRMALAVIEAAERSGELQPGQTVIEATSGNTGIALAMVCAQKNYPLVVVMAESFSVERRRLMRFLGAKVVLTPAAQKGTGMLAKAVELAQAHGYYLCRQFDNDANAEVHSRTTAQEILDDFSGEQLDYWVSGFGTGGTLNGVSRRFRKDSPHTKIIVAEPDNSPLLGSGVAQPRNAEGEASASHPHFRPHMMQGWSPDFVSSLTERAVQTQSIDEIIPVAGNDALYLSRALAQKEGIFTGISAGATLAAALEVASRSEPGTNIVCMLPDTGERYMSTPLFEDIIEEMNAEELALSHSTPAGQFVTAPPPTRPAKTAPAVPVELNPQARLFVDNMVSKKPVVMFALEWCEFCWSVRKLFKLLEVDYESVDLDCVDLQENDAGGKIRQVLAADLQTNTIPQIFVGGIHIGGATELFSAYEDGSLQAKLNDAAVSYNHDAKPELNKLMPQWLQPRKSA